MGEYRPTPGADPIPIEQPTFVQVGIDSVPVSGGGGGGTPPADITTGIDNAAFNAAIAAQLADILTELQALTADSVAAPITSSGPLATPGAIVLHNISALQKTSTTTIQLTVTGIVTSATFRIIGSNNGGTSGTIITPDDQDVVVTADTGANTDVSLQVSTNYDQIAVQFLALDGGAPTATAYLKTTLGGAG